MIRDSYKFRNSSGLARGLSFSPLFPIQLHFPFWLSDFETVFCGKEPLAPPLSLSFSLSLSPLLSLSLSPSPSLSLTIDLRLLNRCVALRIVGSGTGLPSCSKIPIVTLEHLETAVHKWDWCVPNPPRKTFPHRNNIKRPKYRLL